MQQMEVGEAVWLDKLLQQAHESRQRSCKLWLCGRPAEAGEASHAADGGWEGCMTGQALAASS
jgi:hypothetical protein